VVDRNAGDVQLLSSADGEPQRTLTHSFFTGIEDTQQGVATITDDQQEEKKDNRFMKNDGTAQKLTSAEIETMKETAKDGQQIIDALIKNNETWD